MENQAAESLADVYRSVFASEDEAQPARESASREGKSFALTREHFERKKRELVKTIAAIANVGADVGYVVFRGGTEEDAPVDLADVDNAVRSRVYPRVAVEHARETIDGRVVDFLRVARGLDRPYMMLTDSGEMIVPFRGAANNITAARHEIDAMYEERTLSLIRRALGATLSPSADPVEQFLEEVDWGDVSQASDPEFVFAIVPVATSAVFAEMVRSQTAHIAISNAWTETIQKDEQTDWFALRGDFVTAPRDGYIEAYQPAADNHRIGTILIYSSGAVIVRSWILEPEVIDEPIYSDFHFMHALFASLKFTWRLYKQIEFPAGELEVRCMVINAQDLNLWLTPAGAQKRIAQNRDVGRRLILPRRPLRVQSGELETNAKDISERVVAALRTHYGR